MGELAKVTSTPQFLNGVQSNPELVFEDVKTLAKQSIGEGTAASQLQNSYQQIFEKEQKLLNFPKELGVVKKNLKDLENSSASNSAFEKLALSLDRLQFSPHKSATITSTDIFNGDKKMFPT